MNHFNFVISDHHTFELYPYCDVVKQPVHVGPLQGLHLDKVLPLGDHAPLPGGPELATIQNLMGMFPLSKYRSSFGVELGDENIFLSNVSSIDPRLLISFD